MRGIELAFGGAKAVDVELWPGEVLGLVGHNGAGKSSLVRVLAGACRRDAGEIRVTEWVADVTEDDILAMTILGKRPARVH
jgi:D-xylose transport system ATP-binding protein